MDFLKKVEPFLENEDIYVQKFVLHLLDEIVEFVPGEWTERLLQDVVISKEKEPDILNYLYRFPLNEGAVKLLMEGLKNADKSSFPFYQGFLNHIAPSLALKYKNELAPFFESSDWEFFRLIEEGEEEDIWEEYGSYLYKLDHSENFNEIYYTRAKQLINVMVKNNWVDENEVELILEEQVNEEYFDYKGILAVYMIRMLKLPTYIPLLVSFLDRDEDILLEEVSDTLVSFQSDDVVKRVAPYAKKEESSVFAISILSGTKTPYAIKVLRELMNEVKYEDDQSLVLEGLCHQLSKDALPEVEQYMNSNPESFMIEIESIAYGYYKVMGLEHPNLLKWRGIAEEKDSNQNSFLYSAPINVEQKVGRNDPCPCGSGKKYKKCCGA
jgi:hypothetical protein